MAGAEVTNVLEAVRQQATLRARDRLCACLCASALPLGMQAFACLVRVYEAAAAAASGTAAAQPAEQQPQLDAVQHLCWRMNISRCAGWGLAGRRQVHVLHLRSRQRCFSSVCCCDTCLCRSTQSALFLRILCIFLCLVC